MHLLHPERSLDLSQKKEEKFEATRDHGLGNWENLHLPNSSNAFRTSEIVFDRFGSVRFGSGGMPSNELSQPRDA